MKTKYKKVFSTAIIIFIALITIIGLSGSTFFVSSENQKKNSETENEPKNNYQMERIFLKTSDDIQIAADYSKVDKSKYSEPKAWLVLIHMMPETKESWAGFSSQLRESGYESLAIDLRGHGESQFGPEGFGGFSDADHQKSIFDVDAAVEFLKDKGAAPEKIFFIGASIGANLSLQYISEHPEFKTAVLLSPGLDYRGIKTEPMVKNLKPGQRVLFVSSQDDFGNSPQSKTLYNEAADGVKKQIEIYETGGHGTNILKNQPGSTNLIIKFLQNE